MMKTTIPTTPKKGRVDWVQVRTRLETSERAWEESLAETPARVEAAYRERAARLAKGSPERRLPSAASPALAFSLGQERYAVELRELAEALPFAQCTPVPGALPEFRGVLNVRGELRAVVDLGRMVLEDANADDDSGFVLMLRRPGREIGLRIDRVEGLCDIPLERVSSSPLGKYAKAIDGETLRLLDVDQVLAAVFAEEKEA